MRQIFGPTRLALGAAALLALLVVPVAVASTDGDSGDPQATASGVQQKVKKLKKQVKEANEAIEQLQQQVAGLQGEQGGARPPSGSAGGDLTGTFPNPEIDDDAVGSSELQPSSVTEPEIANNTVTNAKLADDAVGSPKVLDGSLRTEDIANEAVTGLKLASVITREGVGTVPPSSSRAVAAFCEPGEVALSGGARWEGADDTFVNLWMLQSHKTFASEGWVTRGANPSPTASRTLRASVNCLSG
jgi:hypothetical protein